MQQVEEEERYCYTRQEHHKYLQFKIYEFAIAHQPHLFLCSFR